MISSALVLLALTAPASVTSIPAPVGLEKKLLDDAKDGKLDSMSLLDAALVASGVPDSDVASEAVRAKAALAPAINRAKQITDPHTRGDALLRALHETVFRTYKTTATEIDDVVHSGNYNCLSSALLYVVAADGLVEDPKAMVTKHHAFARVKVSGKPVDVETTTTYGFDADRKKLMTPDYVKKIAGPDTTPAEMLAEMLAPEELPVLSLVAAVYSNRAVGLAQRGDLEAAATALDRAEKLASGALRARTARWRGGILNQGALDLVDQGRLDDAKSLLELAMDGTDGETRALLSQNLATVHIKLADRALADHDFTGALEHVDIAKKLGASDSDVGSVKAHADAGLAAADGNDARCAQTKIAREAAECFAALSHSVRDTDLDRALQTGRRAYALDKSAPNAERALFYSLLKKARVETDAGHCDVVESLAKEATPHLAMLDGQHWSPNEVMAVCWADKANRAFDKKDWTTAGALYDRARAHMPNDARITQNLAAVDVNAAIDYAERGECDPARSLALRARRTDAKLGEKATQVLESCASVRAKKAADAGDYAMAATECRRGLIDAPNSAPLRENLGTMLHNQAAVLLRKHDCDGARALLSDLDALGKTKAAEAIRTSCK